MNKHTFTFTGIKNGHNTFNVLCLETKGEFNTLLWVLGKQKFNICPCCNLEIKK